MPKCVFTGVGAAAIGTLASRSRSAVAFMFTSLGGLQCAGFVIVEMQDSVREN